MNRARSARARPILEFGRLGRTEAGLFRWVLAMPCMRRTLTRAAIELGGLYGLERTEAGLFRWLLAMPCARRTLAGVALEFGELERA